MSRLLINEPKLRRLGIRHIADGENPTGALHAQVLVDFDESLVVEKPCGDVRRIRLDTERRDVHVHHQSLSLREDEFLTAIGELRRILDAGGQPDIYSKSLKLGHRRLRDARWSTLEQSFTSRQLLKA